MPERSFIARWFLAGGLLLALTGLALGQMLPGPAGFPPYLVTAALALLYGTFCLVPFRPGGDKKS